jgi:hypothetical protein
MHLQKMNGSGAIVIAPRADVMPKEIPVSLGKSGIRSRKSTFCQIVPEISLIPPCHGGKNRA